MDPILAELYGTNEIAGDDTEKLAAAQMAEELADEEQLNLDAASDDEIEALAQEVLSDGETEEAEMEAAAEGDDEEYLPKEAAAQADHMGRMMAHAYVQELRGIEKEASGEIVHRKDLSRRVDDVGHAQHSKKHRVPGSVSDRIRKGLKKGVSAVKDNATKAGKHVWKNKKYYGGGAGAAAAIGAGAYALSRRGGKRKHSSALDTLAEQRALEILQENGITPAAEKTAASPEMLEQAVEQRAWEMLAANGYVAEDAE